MLIQHIVDYIISIKKVDNRRILIGMGNFIKIQWKIKYQSGAAIGRISRHILGRAIFVSVHIITTGNGVFRTISPVGIVPGKRRRLLYKHIGKQRTIGETRRFSRIGEYIVGPCERGGIQQCPPWSGKGVFMVAGAFFFIKTAMLRPVVFFNKSPIGGIYANIPPIGTSGRADIHIPGQMKGITHDHIHQRHLNITAGNAGIGICKYLL